MRDLTVVVPSRGRPINAARLIDAWAGATADLVFAVDRDDPALEDYAQLGTTLVALPEWKPMCVKLNEVAVSVAEWSRHVGFMGDDHLPRTEGWDTRIVDALDCMELGMVYPNDGYQGEKLPTSVFMDARIVRSLGWMVPPGIEHLYCDNAWMALGEALGTLRYLPDVVVEHLHPHAGKAASDEQYARVNSAEQTDRDRAAFERWRSTIGADVKRIREMSHC